MLNVVKIQTNFLLNKFGLLTSNMSCINQLIQEPPDGTYCWYMTEKHVSIYVGTYLFGNHWSEIRKTIQYKKKKHVENSWITGKKDNEKSYPKTKRWVVNQFFQFSREICWGIQKTRTEHEISKANIFGLNVMSPLVIFFQLSIRESLSRSPKITQKYWECCRFSIFSRFLLWKPVY